MNIGLCKHNNDCPNKDNCKRYIDTIGDKFDFYRICNEDNGFTWYWAINDEVVK